MHAPVLIALALAVSPSPPRTFRVDAYHTGNATEERFALDRLVVEPLPFPGNPDRPLDEMNIGKYLFEVRDLATNRLVYSRGYATIFGEWETTAEAKEANRTSHESLRFPAPDGPVQVVVRKRDRRNAFREIWSIVVDPKDMFVDPSPPAPAGPLIEIQRSGPPEQKLDLLILGDGYTRGECAAFEAQARRLTEALFAVEPFRSRRGDLNVWALCPPSRESGVSRPSTGIHRNSPVGATFDAFGLERYVLAFDDRRFREVASQAPYDFVAILVNAETYGGGGIQGLYATVAGGSLWAPYIFVHELGHHIAGLADEYFTSDVAYLPGERVEPWERNVPPSPIRRGRSGEPRRGPRYRHPGTIQATRSAPASSRRSARPSASATGRNRRWTRPSWPRRRRRARSCRPSPTPPRREPSRGRTTRRRAPTAPRSTASCSRATTCPSVPHAGARSATSSTSTRGRDVDRE